MAGQYNGRQEGGVLPKSLAKWQRVKPAVNPRNRLFGE